MCQGMSTPIVFSRESFGVVLAADDGTFLRSLELVGGHVSLEVFEEFATSFIRAFPFSMGLIAGGRFG